MPRCADPNKPRHRKKNRKIAASEEEPSAKRPKIEHEPAEAMDSIVMVLAQYLLDDKLNEDRKIQMISLLVTSEAGPGVDYLRLKCRDCQVEKYYTLRETTTVEDSDGTLKQVKEFSASLDDLRKALQKLGVLCHVCLEKVLEDVRRWPDGYLKSPPSMNTHGDLIKGIITIIEIFMRDESILGVLRQYIDDSTPIDRSRIQHSSRAQNDELQSISKHMKSMSDGRMRLEGKTGRDAAQNKRVVAKCSRVWVQDSYVSNAQDHAPTDPGNHSIESTLAADLVVKMRLFDIYDRDENSFWGLPSFTFSNTPLPNRSVPKEEEYLFIPVRHLNSKDPATMNRKVMVDGPTIRNGYIKALPSHIPYHYPIAPAEGGVVPQFEPYVKQYVGAVSRYQTVKAELGSKSLAVQQMRHEARSEASQDLVAALLASSGIRALPDDRAMPASGIREATSRQRFARSSLASSGAESSTNTKSVDGSRRANEDNSDTTVTSNSSYYEDASVHDSEMVQVAAEGHVQQDSLSKLSATTVIEQIGGTELSLSTASLGKSGANALTSAELSSVAPLTNGRPSPRSFKEGDIGCFGMLGASMGKQCDADCRPRDPTAVDNTTSLPGSTSLTSKLEACTTANEDMGVHATSKVDGTDSTN